MFSTKIPASDSIDFKILFTDFDGTLFSESKSVSDADVRILRQLGEQGIVRVIATGRSYFSIRKVIPADFPIDFIILSSGAGIMDWPSKRLLKSISIAPELSRRLVHLFIKNDLSFFVHHPFPQNHLFYYFSADNVHADFKRRLKLYADIARPIEQRPNHQSASQFLLIESDSHHIRKLIAPYSARLNLIRATSPLDGKSFWFEIFDAHVSKKQAGEWLCQRLNIAQRYTMAVGNDYNDVDLLGWCAKSFVVTEAPESLRKNFDSVSRQNGSVLEGLF